MEIMRYFRVQISTQFYIVNS